MGRKSSGDVRFGNMTQWNQRKLKKKKQNAKKNDSRDWTAAVFARLEKDKGNANDR
ncbi:hypothetical protein [Rossellomorea aquimaris]|uniref:hypothetical protein n=1 Tax=Rossellomorea aquimaris TaxID=189382 RepID=UPI001653812A|nr:hypothetical protein [Rossellomorea aquimaris]